MLTGMFRIVRPFLILCVGHLLCQFSAIAQDKAAPQSSSGPSEKEEVEILEAMSADQTLKDMKHEGEMVEIKQVWGDFARQQHLDSQQADRFFDLLVGKYEVAGPSEGRPQTDKAGDSNSSPEKDPIKIEEAEEAARWQQLRTLLGETNYGRLQEYVKGANERLAVAQMREHLGTRNIVLTDTQATTILQIMWEERAKTTPVAFDPRAPIPPLRAASLAVTGDNLERYVEAQTDLNQRILARAAAILDPVQLRALDTFQQRHLAAEKVGWGVVRERKRREEASAVEDDKPAP